MSLPVATESALAERLRLMFRAYRRSRFCLGHGLVRRLFRAMIGQHQRIHLRNGLRLEVDLASEVQQTLFWMDGDLEPQLEWVIRELMPVGAPCVDCGANCGYIGLLARRYREAPVWFIEPHPRLAATVRRNLELNHFQGTCRVIEAAASDQSGEATFYIQDAHDGSHSLLPNWHPDAAGVSELKVRTDRLPVLLGQDPALDRIGLLKVDAEGHDVAVLRGLGEWLNPRRIGMVYAELSRDREAGHELLQSAGYVGFGQPALKRPEFRRRLQSLYAGQPAVLFEPHVPERHGDAETLWLPKGSPAAEHLATLARLSAEASA